MTTFWPDSDCLLNVRSFLTREERNRIEREQRQSQASSQQAQTEEVSRAPGGAIRNIESRIKSSKSLQNLESVTAESLRSVRERTSDLGENVRRRYGSQFNVACGKYEHLPDDSEDIDSHWVR